MDDINVETFKQYDMVIGLFEATNLSINEGYDEFKRCLRVVRQSGVRFYPRPDFIDFAAHKFRWIKRLEKNGLPVLDTIAIRNDKGITYAKEVLKKIEEKDGVNLLQNQKYPHIVLDLRNETDNYTTTITKIY